MDGKRRTWGKVMQVGGTKGTGREGVISDKISLVGLLRQKCCGDWDQASVAVSGEPMGGRHNGSFQLGFVAGIVKWFQIWIDILRLVVASPGTRFLLDKWEYEISI